MLYKVIQRPLPGTDPVEKKWYATALAAGEVTLENMAYRLSGTCTVTRADIMAVLTAFVDNIGMDLKNGMIVKLGELGNLQLGLSSKGVGTLDEWSPEQIRRAHVNFRPGKKLKQIAAETGFKRTYTASSN